MFQILILVVRQTENTEKNSEYQDEAINSQQHVQYNREMYTNSHMSRP